ncbi:unnamed protein product [Pedinophyceae sp. YPF-701]|nr:unnamed protein product [Pedinophyceae sp. YPF-701]
MLAANVEIRDPSLPGASVTIHSDGGAETGLGPSDQGGTVEAPTLETLPAASPGPVVDAQGASLAQGTVEVTESQAVGIQVTLNDPAAAVVGEGQPLSPLDGVDFADFLAGLDPAQTGPASAAQPQNGPQAPQEATTPPADSAEDPPCEASPECNPLAILEQISKCGQTAQFSVDVRSTCCTSLLGAEPQHLSCLCARQTFCVAERATPGIQAVLRRCGIEQQTYGGAC